MLSFISHFLHNVLVRVIDIVKLSFLIGIMAGKWLRPQHFCFPIRSAFLISSISILNSTMSLNISFFLSWTSLLSVRLSLSMFVALTIRSDFLSDGLNSVDWFHLVIPIPYGKKEL